MPESILRILDYVAPVLFVIVAIAIPAFAIIAIPYAVQKCALAPKRVRRPFRLRIRIWQLMAAVLVVGTVLEIAILTQRAYHAHNKAEVHASEASHYRWMLGREPSGFWIFNVKAPPLEGLPSLVDYYQSLERYHEGLRQKYHDLSRHPWRSVSPDPPEPTLPEWPGTKLAEFLVSMRELENIVRFVYVMDSQ